MSDVQKIGLLHPGAMGVSLGQSILAQGLEVCWVTAGRSAATAARAANFSPVGSLADLVDQVAAIVAVCPPDQAETVAAAVAAQGFSGLYIDANAIAPHTAQAVADRFGDQYVDAGIIGPPAVKPGSTRLYLSGQRAHEVESWFAAGPMGARAIGVDPTAASALKMCYAAYSKGTSALVLAIRGVAESYGVAEELVAEWDVSQVGLSQRSEQMASATAPKAWRFAGEMDEIAATFAHAGLPDGFHVAAAEIYRRMAFLKNAEDPDLTQVLNALNAQHSEQAN